MTQPPHHDQLSAYLDGELEPDEIDRVEAELRANPALRAELDELREVAAFLREAGPARAPADFHARVLAAVEAEAPQQTWWAWLRRPFGLPLEGLAVAAAAAAVLWIALPAPEPAPSSDKAAAQPTAAGPSDGVAAVEEADEPAPEASRGGLESGSHGGELRTAGYRYRLVAQDPAVLGALSALAERHGGKVHDTAGAVILDRAQPVGTTIYAVRLPADALSAFHREVDQLGVQVQREPDGALFADTHVEISVTVEVRPPDAGEKGAPAPGVGGTSKKAPPGRSAPLKP